MTNRKKRLAKGIESLEEQIKIHEEKKQTAKEDCKIELEEYYGNEIASLKKRKQRQMGMLDKA